MASGWFKAWAGKEGSMKVEDSGERGLMAESGPSSDHCSHENYVGRDGCEKRDHPTIAWH
jgi:hypothetical protein